MAMFDWGTWLYWEMHPAPNYYEAEESAKCEFAKLWDNL